MIKKLTWKMFENTGNIEYYLQYRNIKRIEPEFKMEAGEEVIVDGVKCRMSKPGAWLSGK